MYCCTDFENGKRRERFCSVEALIYWRLKTIIWICKIINILKTLYIPIFPAKVTCWVPKLPLENTEKSYNLAREALCMHVQLYTLYSCTLLLNIHILQYICLCIIHFIVSITAAVYNNSSSFVQATVIAVNYFKLHKISSLSYICIKFESIIYSYTHGTITEQYDLYENFVFWFICS